MMQVEQDTGWAPLGGRAVQTAVRGLGVAVSVALVAGVGIWGWKLAVRDVSGVPVVRALEGPMRVAPPDPGGMQAAYQGLSVNAVAAGDAAALPAQVVLAPAAASLADLPESAPRPGDGPTGRSARPDGGAGDGNRAASGADPDLAQAVLRSDGASGRIEVIPAAVPGVARSPVPRLRPNDDLLTETAAMAALQSLAPGSALEVDPDSLRPGTRLVQLGAFDDPANARAEWEALTTRFPSLLEGKGRVVQSAEAGGRSFYRLRAAGFGDEAEVGRFCAVLLHENRTCIPVLIR